MCQDRVRLSCPVPLALFRTHSVPAAPTGTTPGRWCALDLGLSHRTGRWCFALVGLQQTTDSGCRVAARPCDGQCARFHPTYHSSNGGGGNQKSKRTLGRTTVDHRNARRVSQHEVVDQRQVGQSGLRRRHQGQACEPLDKGRDDVGRDQPGRPQGPPPPPAAGMRMKNVSVPRKNVVSAEHRPVAHGDCKKSSVRRKKRPRYLTNISDGSRRL